MLLPITNTYPSAISHRTGTVNSAGTLAGEPVFASQGETLTKIRSRVSPLFGEGFLIYWQGIHGNGKRLLFFILINFIYLSVEFVYGITVGQSALVSDAFHLGFGCCVLSTSLVANFYARKSSDQRYTYGYQRGEILAAFTNVCFLFFMSFSLGVEALHSSIEPEDEHRHYLIPSAVANLGVNLLGVLFFRNYARVHMTYRCPEDLNLHAIFLHVAADSVRSGGVILSLWLLALGVPQAEALVQLLTAVIVLLLAFPLFNSASRILLQGTPESLECAALRKCVREASAGEGVQECSMGRFWALHPGSLVGTMQVKVQQEVDEQRILRHVHSVFESNLGPTNLTVQVTKDP